MAVAAANSGTFVRSFRSAASTIHGTQAMVSRLLRTPTVAITGPADHAATSTTNRPACRAPNLRPTRPAPSDSHARWRAISNDMAHGADTTRWSHAGGYSTAVSGLANQASPQPLARLSHGTFPAISVAAVSWRIGKKKSMRSRCPGTQPTIGATTKASGTHHSPMRRGRLNEAPHQVRASATPVPPAILFRRR